MNTTTKAIAQLINAAEKIGVEPTFVAELWQLRAQPETVRLRSMAGWADVAEDWARAAEYVGNPAGATLARSAMVLCDSLAPSRHAATR